MPVHRGLEFVYWEADRAIALDMLQLPSCEIDPTTLMVCPNVVVASSLNDTATVAAGVQVPPAVVLVDKVVAGFVVLVGVPEPPPIAMSAQER